VSIEEEHLALATMIEAGRAALGTPGGGRVTSTHPVVRHSGRVNTSAMAFARCRLLCLECLKAVTDLAGIQRAGLLEDGECFAPPPLRSKSVPLLLQQRPYIHQHPGT
jgi:hypothetical protein